VEEIRIDEKTRIMLLDCDRTIVITNQRMQDICQTLFNVNDIDVNKDRWQLSVDRTKLFKVSKPVEAIKEDLG